MPVRFEARDKLVMLVVSAFVLQVFFFAPLQELSYIEIVTVLVLGALFARYQNGTCSTACATKVWYLYSLIVPQPGLVSRKFST